MILDERTALRAYRRETKECLEAMMPDYFSLVFRHSSLV